MDGEDKAVFVLLSALIVPYIATLIFVGRMNSELQETRRAEIAAASVQQCGQAGSATSE